MILAWADDAWDDYLYEISGDFRACSRDATRGDDLRYRACA